MKVVKTTKKVTVYFNYLEWVELGKILPTPPEISHDKITKYIIREVPEDKKEYFESLGCEVVLYASKWRGKRI